MSQLMLAAEVFCLVVIKFASNTQNSIHEVTFPPKANPFVAPINKQHPLLVPVGRPCHFSRTL